MFKLRQLSERWTHSVGSAYFVYCTGLTSNIETTLISWHIIESTLYQCWYVSSGKCYLLSRQTFVGSLEEITCHVWLITIYFKPQTLQTIFFSKLNRRIMCHLVIDKRLLSHSILFISFWEKRTDRHILVVQTPHKLSAHHI